MRTTIEPLGRAYLDVCHSSQQHRLPAIIVHGSGPNLLGRDWLAVLKVNGATVYQVGKVDFLKLYESVFSDGMGTLKGMKVKFYIMTRLNRGFANLNLYPLLYERR